MRARTPGVLCSARLGTHWIDHGTLHRSRSSEPGPQGLIAALSGPFDQVFQALATGTGKPIANTPYRITLESGRVFLGITDGLGRTARVGADRAQRATLEIPYHGDNPGPADTRKRYDACSR